MYESLTVTPRLLGVANNGELERLYPTSIARIFGAGETIETDKERNIVVLYNPFNIDSIDNTVMTTEMKAEAKARLKQYDTSEMLGQREKLSYIGRTRALINIVVDKARARKHEKFWIANSNAFERFKCAPVLRYVMIPQYDPIGFDTIDDSLMNVFRYDDVSSIKTVRLSIICDGPKSGAAIHNSLHYITYNRNKKQNAKNDELVDRLCDDYENAIHICF